MMNSLRSGVSGIKSHQVRMDVVGNNIANVNTLGFKRSRVAFHEVLAQLQLGVARSAGGTGVNPSAVGRGVKVGSIDQDWSQGAFEATNIPTDLALTGDGFFLARDTDGQTLLTRAGNFTFNGSGELTTAGGLPVMGWSIDSAGNADMSQLRDVRVNFLSQQAASPKFSENIGLGGNLSSDAAIGETITVSTAVYDEQGNSYNAVIEFTKTAANQWDYTIEYDGAAAPPPFADVAGTADFDVNGNLISPASVDLTWDPAYVTGGGTMTVNLSEMTQYSGSTTLAISDQDGYTAGRFVGYSIGADGIVSLNFSNGEQKHVFQLALGNVSNPNGLFQKGDNMYGTGPAAGDLVLGRPGSEFQTSVVAGALEMSNVDLATEFTDMIVTQRGYQASARVVTTSDELLQELVQLKR